jgi:hypothetical protein
MTPQELRTKITEQREWDEAWAEYNAATNDQTPLPNEEEKVDDADESTEEEEDICEALTLLDTSREKLLRCLKVDKAHKSLTTTERNEITELLGEIQLFTEQWDWKET